MARSSVYHVMLCTVLSIHTTILPPALLPLFTCPVCVGRQPASRNLELLLSRSGGLMAHHTTLRWDAFAKGTPLWDVDPVPGELVVGLNGDMYYIPPGDALVSASGAMAETPKTLGYILGEEIWSFLMGWDEQDPVADTLLSPPSQALDLR
ncbi:unnamed protein product [Triticum turgidum subsp. durum]|uniref:Uncharacterized protein n=1 Tax=Triticum turgidum subsp. durum TaxID=4567 RepID=A0A9R1R1E3_TRITD|nr:unnamed protein product [Triticum turgidum subsp. durum]